jgi:HAD superfamily hydrolase (TIGR01490 family)
VNLALFDFDGTITTKGTYVEFIRFAVSRPRQLLGTLLLSPLIAAYRMGWVSAQHVRPAVARLAFSGLSVGRLRELGAQFAACAIPPLVREEAGERIAWHKRQGDAIVIVSASLDVYLTSWCKENQLDLICTELEVRGDRATGRYLAGDCTGAEKKRRILARYDLARYPIVYAYGDTTEDNDMLSLAHKRYLCWRELESFADARECGASSPR